MSLKPLDPDLKVNMTLDEIIHLTKPPLNCLLDRKRFRKKRRTRKVQSSDNNDHSVLLMSSLGGGYIMVSKKSPLLSPANRRRIANAVFNRQINSQLIENTKEIIPAQYQLVKTDSGVERVLVPVKGISPTAKILLNRILKNSGQAQLSKNLPKLMDVPIQIPRPLHKPSVSFFPNNEVTNGNNSSTEMEVDDDDSEVKVVAFVLGNKRNPNPPVIDLEPNEGESITAVTTHSGSKTLNERFSQLRNSLSY